MLRLLDVQLVDMNSQTRFMAGRSILMQNAILNGLVKKRNSLRQQFLRLRSISGGDHGPQFFHLATEAGAIGSIDGISTRVLTISLLSGFMFRHKV
jgi:hypothetical protein